MSNFREQLCANNIALLTEIEKKIPVIFEEWDKKYWSATIRDSGVGVVYHPLIFSDAKAAHELLHIKIGLIMGNNKVLFDEAIKRVSSIPSFLFLFQHDVCQYFLNSYEHMKIFQEYLDMGFESSDFFENDGHDEGINTPFFDVINKGGLSLKGEYKIALLGQYICTTIAHMSYPFDNSKKKGLKILERTEKPLFKIIKNYWDKILSLPLTDEGKTKMDEEHKNFIKSMEKWIAGKKII